MTKTTYNAPSMRLPGMGHCGGILTVIEQDDGKVILEMSQLLGGTNGTEWRTDIRVHTATEWNYLAPLVLKGCTSDPRIYRVGGRGPLRTKQNALDVANGIFEQTGAFVGIEKVAP
jgi:hypothetical protein